MQVDINYLDRIAELTLYARLAWVAAVLALIVLLLYAMRRRGVTPADRRDPWRRISGFHRACGATASMEYLMVLFPFLVIVMTVWQLAFMFNAKLHVSYATFAAARSAAVMVPAELDGEEAGKLKKDAKKWERIERAALPGTIAVSPGTGTDAAGVYAAHNLISAAQSAGFNTPQTPDAQGAASRLLLMSAHMCNTPVFCSPEVLTGTRPLRAAVKDYYAQNMTMVRIRPAGSSTFSDSSKDVDFKDQDILKVSVEYVFWLQVPYVGRLMEALFKSAPDALANLNPYPSMTMSEETTIKVWHKKRATEPCP